MNEFKRYFFIFLILVPSLSWAQFNFGVTFGYSPASKIALKPSLNSTNPYINSTKFVGEKPDYGIIVRYFNEKLMGFQGELNFIQRGYNSIYKYPYEYRRVNDYIELPLLAQVHIKFAGLYLHLNAGCYGAYLISSKHGVDTSGVMVLNPYKFNVLRDNRFDYGLLGGPGLSYEFKWGVILMEFRYVFSFVDLYKYSYPEMPEKSRVTAQVIKFSYMYNFSKLSKKRKPNENL